MYQSPVGDLETLRQSRKRVKSILSDIGLESCNKLFEVCSGRGQINEPRSYLRLCILNNINISKNSKIAYFEVFQSFCISAIKKRNYCTNTQ